MGADRVLFLPAGQPIWVNGDKLTVFKNQQNQLCLEQTEAALTLGACGVFGFWKNRVISAFSALMRYGGEETRQALTPEHSGKVYCPQPKRDSSSKEAVLTLQLR